MFQRTILRASRQAARPVQRIQPAAFAPIRQQTGTRAAAPAIRWYSDAAPQPEAKPKEDAAEASKDDGAQLKEQLEKKDKEIIDLKVRPHSIHIIVLPRDLFLLGEKEGKKETSFPSASINQN